MELGYSWEQNYKHQMPLAISPPNASNYGQALETKYIESMQLPACLTSPYTLPEVIPSGNEAQITIRPCMSKLESQIQAKCPVPICAATIMSPGDTVRSFHGPTCTI